MDPGKFKAVFIDIDGTLLRNDHTVGPATVVALQKVLQKGISVILVSARPLHGIISIASQIGVEGFPIASLNGACIAQRGQIIFESIIDLPTTIALCSALQPYKHTPIFYTDMQWYATVDNALSRKEQLITDVPLIIQPFEQTCLDWQRQKSGPNKILVIAEPDITRDIEDALKKQFGSDLNIYTSKPTYLEIMSSNASKLLAVKFLLQRMECSREEIITIGDNFNDMEMIAFAGLGVAMGNAPEEVKAVAAFVTSSNNEEGVAAALLRFLDI